MILSSSPFPFPPPLSRLDDHHRMHPHFFPCFSVHFTTDRLRRAVSEQAHTHTQPPTLFSIFFDGASNSIFQLIHLLLHFTWLHLLAHFIHFTHLLACPLTKMAKIINRQAVSQSVSFLLPFILRSSLSLGPFFEKLQKRGTFRLHYLLELSSSVAAVAVAIFAI